MIDHISSVPLSSQNSQSQEQEPSQEEYKPSPEPETIKVDTADTKTEEENQELESDSDIVEKETSFLEDIKNTSNDQQEEEGVAVINTENNITEDIVTENNNSATDDNNKVTENNISVTDDSIKETEHNNSVTDDNIKETENNNNNSVTDDNIEAAKLEIVDIFLNNNNNNTITNIETNTDCQKSPPTSPQLTFVVDMDSSPVSQVSQVSNTSLKRLEYGVIHATSWDDNYPPHQLLPKDKNSSKEGQIKYGKGWQSERYCTYPQEIILQVSCGAARIRKLLILSHHYKIATKLEIYVGSIQQRKEMVGKNTNTGGSLDEKNEKRTLSWDKLPKIIENDGMNSEEDESSEENDYDIIRSNGEPYILFKRLGYCALDNNERANYKSRELKTVLLDTECEYIRFVARRCYENDLNKYKQVGIVGITIMGEPADYLLAGESQKIPFEHVDEGLSRVASPETCIVPLIQDNNWINLYSILPNSSLSVSNNNSSTTTTPLPNNTNDQTNKNKNPVIANDFLSNGEETENLLAAFGRAKQDAVKVEDFNLAKVLKYCTEYVKQAAAEVRKFDGLKKQAVEEEDFDNAEKYKHEAEGIRENVRMTLADEGLNLDDSGEVIVCDPSLNDIIGLADNAEVSSRLYLPMNLGLKVM